MIVYIYVCVEMRSFVILESASLASIQMPALPPALRSSPALIPCSLLPCSHPLSGSLDPNALIGVLSSCGEPGNVSLAAAAAGGSPRIALPVAPMTQGAPMALGGSPLAAGADCCMPQPPPLLAMQSDASAASTLANLSATMQREGAAMGAVAMGGAAAPGWPWGEAAGADEQALAASAEGAGLSNAI